MKTDKEFAREIDERIAQLEDAISEINVFLDDAPLGSAEISARDGRFYYRHTYSNANSGKKEREYLSLENDKQARLLKRLLKKPYYKKLLPHILKELKALRVFKNSYKPEEKYEIYNELSPDRKQLISQVFYTAEEIQQENDEKMRLMISQKYNNWANKYAEYQNAYKTEELVIETSDGHKVRSKSERMIADELAAAGVPYKYELRFTTRDRVVYPDFTIFDMSSGRIYIWEHFGMMDNSRYVNRECLAKIDAYAAEGFVLGKNLFATFETLERPLQVSHVRSVIKLITG